MEFSDFVQWVFYGVIASGLLIGIRTLNELKDSVVSLNITMAKVVLQQEWHAKALEKHDERIRGLEERKAQL